MSKDSPKDNPQNEPKLVETIEKLEAELADAKKPDDICRLCLKLFEIYDDWGTPEAREAANRYLFLATQALIRSGRMAKSVAILNSMKGRANTEAQVQMLRRWTVETFSKSSQKSGVVKADDLLPIPTPYQELKGFISFEDEKTSTFERDQWGRPLSNRQGLFSSLSEREFEAMLELAVVRDLSPNTVLFREGDEAQAFYIVADGEMDLTSSFGVRKAFREGQFFGELALFSKSQRTATLSTAKGAKLLEFSAEDIETCFMLIPALREKVYAFYELRLFFEAASRNRVFQRFSQSELEEIAEYLTPIRVPAARVLMEEGGPSESFFVIAKGHCAVLKNGQELCILSPGHFMGEIGLILHKPRTARVEAISECYLLECQHADFEELLRDYPKFKRVVEEVALLRVQDHSEDPTDPGFRFDPSTWDRRLID